MEAQKCCGMFSKLIHNTSDLCHEGGEVPLGVGVGFPAEPVHEALWAANYREQFLTLLNTWTRSSMRTGTF